MMPLPKLIITIGSLFVVVPVTVAILKYRLLNNTMKNMAFYVFLGASVQIISSYLGRNRQNNLWLLHLFTPLEFAIILRFYSTLLSSIFQKKVFVWTGILFATLSLLNTAFLQEITIFNTYARSLEGVFVIVLCLLWCYKTLTEMKIKKLGQHPVFWVNTGFLLYFSGGVLLFAFSNYILGINKALNMYIWAFHALFSILLYFLITIGLWKAK